MWGRLCEVYNYRSMLWGLVLSELRTRYKGSVLGFVWTFVNPLLMLIIYSLVFATVMRVNIKHYAAFLFIGLLAWNMFSTAVQSSASVIVRQASMVKKIYFPREVLPFSVIGGSLINYLLSLVILLPFLMLSGLEPTWVWLFLPLIVALEAILTAGISLLVSAINVYMRDVEHMLGIFLMAWFYLTPVVYSLNMVPQKYIPVFKLNPVGDFVISLQDILYYHQLIRWKLFLYATAFTIVVFMFGWSVFHRLSKGFAEEV